MANVVWLIDKVVLTIHTMQLAEHGGAPGIRDAGSLESALARPKNLAAYSESEQPPDLARLAAAYAWGIARNHAFVDGNKRTAFVAMRTFLLLNKQNLIASQEDKYLTFIRVAEGNLSEEELAQWIRERMQIER